MCTLLVIRPYVIYGRWAAAHPWPPRRGTSTPRSAEDHIGGTLGGQEFAPPVDLFFERRNRWHPLSDGAGGGRVRRGGVRVVV